MKVYIGADHRGFNYREYIIKMLEEEGHDIVDFGVHVKGKMYDYPRLAYKVGKGVSRAKNSMGILVCMTGFGQVIAANKVRGAYAALCHNAQHASFARQHNNANVLVLSSKYTKKKDLKKVIDTFFNTKAEGGRHKRRHDQIKKIEKGQVLK